MKANYRCVAAAERGRKRAGVLVPRIVVLGAMAATLGGCLSQKIDASGLDVSALRTRTAVHAALGEPEPTSGAAEDEPADRYRHHPHIANWPPEAPEFRCMSPLEPLLRLALEPVAVAWEGACWVVDTAIPHELVFRYDDGETTSGVEYRGVRAVWTPDGQFRNAAELPAPHSRTR